MEINDYEQSQRLLSLTHFTKDDAYSLQTLMQRYVDKHCVVCGKCRGQIRFTVQRYRNWFSREGIVADVVLEDVNLCTVCNEPLKDKRRKKHKDC
jgi:uncharacterized CHY-type Zn-finger protein